MDSIPALNGYDSNALVAVGLAQGQGQAQRHLPQHVSHQNALMHQHTGNHAQHSQQHPQQQQQQTVQGYPYVGYAGWSADAPAPRPASSVSSASGTGGGNGGGSLDIDLEIDMGQTQSSGVQYRSDMQMSGANNTHGGHGGQEEWDAGMDGEGMEEVRAVLSSPFLSSIFRISFLRTISEAGKSRANVHILTLFCIQISFQNSMLSAATRCVSPQRKHPRDWETAQQQAQMSLRGAGMFHIDAWDTLCRTKF